jgi:tetratricopeptide (TPR) repeat protein
MCATCMGHNSYMVVSDDILNGIQDKIEVAMNNCFIKNSISPLDSLSKSLDEFKSQNNIIQYWKSYIDYYKGVFYLKLGDQDNSEKIIKKAYTTLGKISNKNSEDYALLALVQSFYIQFTSGMSAGALSSKIVGNAEKALELDSTNLRGWYVLGSNDFYTPASFGGGKKVEYYLKKAISTVSESPKNPYLPTWGREYAFELLIRYYIQNKKAEEAGKYLQIAEKEYPGNYFIDEYKNKLLVK